MFTIVISEKGGAERREAFEKTEITIGRVQGNDLMLPKGNVSKHHARLISRDGRFIVTDLKSTNGTYVNGRKTSQATIVREGDKIYIGDFVLRVEGGQGGVEGQSERSDPTGPRSPVGASPEPAFPVAAVAPSAPGAPHASVSGYPPAPPAGQARAQELSHYPLERDPDSESAPELVGAAIPALPGPPRVPQVVGPRPRPFGAPPVGLSHGATVTQARARGPEPGRAKPPAPVDGPGWRETRKQSARRVALITLVDRVADVIDLAPLDRAPDIDPTLKERIEAAVREQARAMRADGEVPEGLDVDVLTADAVRELVGLGPVGPALEDEDVSEVHVARADVVVVEKRGERQPLVDGLFSSEEAVARAIARLAQRSGAPLRAGEVVVERRLPSGASLFAVGPPASKAWVMTVRKRQRIEASIDDLVRAGSMSRSMADFLVGCVIARANILVVGRGAGSVSTVLSALASAAPIRERVALLHADDEIVVTGGQTVSLWDGNRIVEAERLGSSMSKLGADRVVIGSLGSVAGLAAIDAIGEGSEAILAGHAAPTLHQGLARLAARLTLARPGLSSEVAREAIAVSFDIGVEVARDPDGNLRVHRISDLSTGASSPHEASDIFLSRGDAGSVSFAATGATPTVTRAFAAQGIKLDPAIFQRSH